LHSADSVDVTLTKYGEYLYDNLILFAPRVESFDSLSFDDILEFVNVGGNILVAVDGGITDGMRSFAANCGIEFDKKGTQIIDHFSYEPMLDHK